jgi:hypothetical protein
MLDRGHERRKDIFRMSKHRSSPRRLPLLVAPALLGALFAVFAGGATARSSESPKVISSPTVTDTQGAPLTSVKVGDTIQGNNGSWYCSPPYPGMGGCKNDFQWQRCNEGGGDCANIPGETNQRRVVTQADVGSRLRVMVFGTNYDCNALGTECRYDTREAPSGQTPVVQGTAPAAPAAPAAPSSTGKPTITGLAEERETLTAADGGWTGPTPITTARQWQRCDAQGAGCVGIVGATAPTYLVTSADVGLRLRIFVSATNPGGTTSAASDPTDVVRPLTPRPGRMVIGIEDVSPPQRLIIDRVRFSPSPLRSLTPVTARFRISDTRGFRISSALVQVISVPFGLVRTVAEVETDEQGWATFTLVPTSRLQLRNGGSLVLFVRARKPGENPLAGVSTRRLVRLKLAAPISQ